MNNDTSTVTTLYIMHVILIGCYEYRSNFVKDENGNALGRLSQYFEWWKNPNCGY